MVSLSAGGANCASGSDRTLRLGKIYLQTSADEKLSLQDSTAVSAATAVSNVPRILDFASHVASFSS